ncbi:MAG: tol-pal system protein YbgF [Geobacteraceae bacterium]|nr:tol-pal system protein YbgF [Geobacteraceae bacterium]
MDPKQWLSAVIFCLAAAGCSNNDILVKKQTEMEARLEQLIQGNAGSNASLAEISNELKELRSQVKANATDLEQLKPGFRELKSAMEAGSHRSEGHPPPAAARIVVVNKAGAGGEPESAEQDAYMKAFGLFSTNDYGGAIASFDSFIATYPGSEYAGNAQYWIGECHYTQRDYPRALQAFTKVVVSYPNGKKVPDAMLKVGFSLISLNQPEQARTALESLVEKYPKSQAAAKARERLSRY